MKGKSQGSRREAEAVDSLFASALRAFPQLMGLLEHLECLFLSGIFAEDLVFLPRWFLGRQWWSILTRKTVYLQSSCPIPFPSYEIEMPHENLGAETRISALNTATISVWKRGLMFT